jgi:hypothetical protein
MKAKWKKILQENLKTRARTLDEYRVDKLHDDIYSARAWKAICKEYEFPYDEAFNGTEMSSKFRRVLNEIHLLSVFGTHSFVFGEEAEEEKDTRDFVLKRIQGIKSFTNYFSRSNFRWRDTKYNGTYLNDIVYEELSNSELVEVFELILRYFYKQG